MEGGLKFLEVKGSISLELLVQSLFGHLNSSLGSPVPPLTPSGHSLPLEPLAGDAAHHSLPVNAVLGHS